MRWSQYRDTLCPGSLSALGRGAEERPTAGSRMQGRRQHAGNRIDSSIEGEFTQRQIAGRLLRRQNTHGCEQTDGDRQIEVAALLGQVGRGKVHDDALLGQRQTERGQGGADSFPALGDRLVRQANDQKVGKATVKAYLHIDLDHLDALKGHRRNPRDHPPRLNLSSFPRLGTPPVKGEETRGVCSLYSGSWRCGWASTFSSIQSQMAAARLMPSKRSISCRPGGEVTLISVR